jgi:5-methylcytosine-specific restriction endonuclease McrA
MKAKEKRGSGGGNKLAYEKGLAVYVKSIRRSDEDVFVENSTYARHHIKHRIIQQGLVKYECAECGNNGEWMGKKLPLILDHMNGVNDDNRIENLRFVCSNCDSQLPTYKNRRGSKGKKLEE